MISVIVREDGSRRLSRVHNGILQWAIVDNLGRLTSGSADLFNSWRRMSFTWQREQSSRAC